VSFLSVIAAGMRNDALQCSKPCRASNVNGQHNAFPEGFQQKQQQTSLTLSRGALLIIATPAIEPSAPGKRALEVT